MRLLRTLGEVVPAACVVAARVGAQAPPAQGPPPPGYTTTRTGGPHDFDYFAGGWTTAQRRLVYVRFRWTKIDQNRAHWEQAFSYDGRTWQTNWTAEFHRADTARVCEGGRPTP